MEFSKMYTMAMDIPEGKRAGYYAQIVKALAEKPLFDRDKELLIFRSAADRREAEPVMRQYAVPYVEQELLFLPDEARTFSVFGDYGFRSRLEHAYVYGDQAAVFRLERAQGSARAYEPVPAALQLEEHLLADWTSPAGERTYVIGAEHDALAEGIARAYGGQIRWLYHPNTESGRN